MSSSVEKIKDKLPIEEVISSYIKLEKSGNNFKAKCPFHNERTPSFFVSPSRGSYYCFGCGVKGDIFTFVQEFEGTDFLGSLKILAERAGVPLERVNLKEKGEKERLYQTLETATLFFVKNLNDNPDVIQYLEKRGLKKETIEEWRLGFVNDEWRSLIQYLKEKDFKEEEIVKSGLAKKSESQSSDGAGYYDVFRGRIMFPIFDNSNRIIGFSGRIFHESKNAPKYLNTPETILFRKSEVLYGINKAKNFIRSKDYSVLVEGQMDLLMSHQSGFTNTVATSGTAFTREHLDKLRKLSNKILMVFDSDNAGFMATNKSAVLALSMGMEVKVAQLPAGLDPASLICKDIELWKDSLRNSKHIIDFYLDHLLLEKKDKIKTAKEIQLRVLPYVAMLQSSIEQSHFVSQISRKTGIREEAIWNDLKNTKQPNIIQEADSIDAKILSDERKKRSSVQRRIVGIISWLESVEEPVVSVKDVRSAIKKFVGEDGLNKILNDYKGENEELVFESEAYYDNSDKLKKEINELLSHFEEDFLREEFLNAMSELQEHEQKHDEKKAKELLKVCQSISVKLGELTKKKTVGESVG